jgi:hypothetical protein
MQEQAMTNGANRKSLSRFLAVLLMGLAFVGCAVMLGSGERSLFADGQYVIGPQTAAR